MATNTYGLGPNGLAVRNFFANNLTQPLQNAWDGVSDIGNRFQNAILSSGVNTKKTGFNSGLVSKTKSPAVNSASLNPKAPMITRSTQPTTTAAPTTSTVTKPRNTGSSSKNVSAPKNTGLAASLPPLVAANSPMDAVTAALPEAPSVATTDFSGLASNPAQLYSSGYTGFSDPMNAFKDYGFEPAYGPTGGAGTSGMYKPGAYVTNDTEIDPSTIDQSNSWMNADNLKLGMQGLDLATKMGQAWLGYKNYGLAKDMFAFEKAMGNRNLANQAQTINNELRNAGQVGMSLAGNTMNDAQRAKRTAEVESMFVDGSPVR